MFYAAVGKTEPRVDLPRCGSKHGPLNVVVVLVVGEVVEDVAVWGKEEEEEVENYEGLEEEG